MPDDLIGSGSYEQTKGKAEDRTSLSGIKPAVRQSTYKTLIEEMTISRCVTLSA